MPPHFAYTDTETVNTAAMEGALELTYKIFGGPPLLDAIFVKNADNKETAKCQLELLKGAGKLENTVLKELVKGKKRALKEETVNSAEALEARLQTVFNSSVKISKARAKLVAGVNKKCTVVLAPLETIFPGTCGGAILI